MTNSQTKELMQVSVIRNEWFLGKDTKSKKSKNQRETSLTLAELNNELLHVPSFIPNFTAVNDPICQQHGKIFLRQLRGFKLWALQSKDFDLDKLIR